MYITDLYEDVCEFYDGNDKQFIKDMCYGDCKFCEIIHEGEEVSEHKSTWQDIVFEMHDGRTFMYTIVKDNCGYWGDGETYWDEPEVMEVEEKEIVIKKWVRKITS